MLCGNGLQSQDERFSAYVTLKQWQGGEAEAETEAEAEEEVEEDEEDEF